MARSKQPYPLSRRGKIKLALLTLGGISACIAISVVFNAVVFWDAPQRYFSEAIFSAVVLPIMLAGPLFLYLSLKLRERSILNRTLASLAAHDSLTSLLNRGAFTNEVEQRLDARNRGLAYPCALLLIDADRFKKINDAYGHDVGDMVLIAVARTLTESLRKDDVIGRMGGEEFGAFLTRIDRNDAEETAERLRAAVAGLEFTTPDGEHLTVSISVGCVYFETEANFESLYRAADRSLYDAKATGRNRVSFVHLGVDLVPDLPG